MATNPLSDDDHTHPHDHDADPNASAGWRAEYAYQGVATGTSTDADVRGSRADRLAAATREDRPARYRRKRRQGVTS